MKLIYWCCVDDKNLEYIKNNRVLKKMSQDEEVILIASGRKAIIKCMKFYPLSLVIPIPVNDFGIKTRALFSDLKGLDYDFLVRLDMDTIIMDLDWLEADINGFLGINNMLIGNRAEHSTESHVRGACQIMTKELVDAVDMEYYDYSHPLSFDEPFTNVVLASGGHIFFHNFFEIGHFWRHSLPVWHPIRYIKGKLNPNKFDQWLEMQEFICG